MEYTDRNNPGMGYPPPPSYPQPGYVNPNPVGYQQPQQQQQSQHTYVVNSQPPVGVIGAPPVSLSGAIALSCVVFWCCGWLCGLIAFIVAMIGQNSASAGDNEGAIQMRNVSYGLSIAGIVVGVILIGVIAGIYGSAAAKGHICYKYDYARRVVAYYC